MTSLASHPSLIGAGVAVRGTGRLFSRGGRAVLNKRREQTASAERTKAATEQTTAKSERARLNSERRLWSCTKCRRFIPKAERTAHGQKCDGLNTKPKPEPKPKPKPSSEQPPRTPTTEGNPVNAKAERKTATVSMRELTPEGTRISRELEAMAMYSMESNPDPLAIQSELATFDYLTAAFTNVIVSYAETLGLHRVHRDVVRESYGAAETLGTAQETLRRARRLYAQRHEGDITQAETGTRIT